MNARDWMTHARGDRITTDKVMTDLRVLAADMEQLLRATAGETGVQIASARARAEESLRAAQARVAGLQDEALAAGRAAGRATDAYVHANPWQVMSVCALAGLALGFVLTRGGSTPE
jgi:ElaB/YqjD/DUF883 family membrane-anchored ribosome-binding protein